MIERPLTSINQEGEESGPVFEVEEPTDGQVLAYDGDSGKWKNADAGGGGALVVTATLVDGVLICGTTAGEMWAAINGGQNIIISIADSVAWPVIYADAGFNFYVWNGDSAMAFTAATADDYPTGGD